MNLAVKIFTSTKFAVAVIAVIIALSAVATLLPNGNFVFASPFFIALVGILSISTIICSLTRIAPLWRTIANPHINVSDQFIKALPYHAYLAGVKLSDLRGCLKGYSCLEASDSKEEALFAQKGRIGRIGPYIAHFGVLVLLLGVLVGAAFGYSNQYNNKIAVIPLGGSLQIADFSLKLSNFSVDYYNDGTVKDYRATVYVLDGNSTEIHYVTVNEPLTHKGLTFYLYSYDSTGLAELGQANWVAFQIKSDTGVSFVWGGALIALIGIMLSLYVPHKRIWIKESRQGVLFGGMTNKRLVSFARELDNMRSELGNADRADKTTQSGG